ncbi:MAG: MbcA/ParS/Xre antitoxin family protein [Bacteroidota bacterium]
MSETGKTINLKSIIGKHSLKTVQFQYMLFEVEQNIDGKSVIVKKQLPLEGLGIMRVVKKGGDDRKVANQYGKKITRRIHKHSQHKIVLEQSNLKKLDEKLMAKVFKQLSGIDISYSSLNKGTINTDSLSATTRRNLRRTLLDSSVLKIIESGEYDDEKLRPFLDFNYEMPKKVFKKVVKKCGFNSTQWSEIIGVNEERVNSSRAFNHQQSMHVLKILLLFNHSYVVFNDKAYFKRWLKKTNPDLGGTPPYFYLDSPSGIDVVRKRMHRIEHGIYS